MPTGRGSLLLRGGAGTARGGQAAYPRRVPAHRRQRRQAAEAAAQPWGTRNHQRPSLARRGAFGGEGLSAKLIGGTAGNPIDQRIEAFLADVLALAGENPDAIREGVRVARASCEALFRVREPNKRMRDKAAHACRALCRARVAEELQCRRGNWEAERDALRLVFEKHGVEVLRPRLLTKWEKEAGGKNGFSNSYVRDPWFTVGNVVIEGSLRFPHRRKEVLPSRDIFRSEVYPAACRYVAAPQPEIVPLEINNGGPGPFLEGGDVLVHGRHVFVGTSGRASTALGAEWLSKLLAPDGYRVEIVRLKPNILHLDCAMGLVREGIVVVCEAVLLDGLPRSLKDWVRLPVSEEDAMNLGTNGLPISPNVYVTDPAFRHIGDEVGKHGITVEYVEFSISRAFGGAFRCSTQPLWRE
jgi:glycine amidinotransferase